MILLSAILGGLGLVSLLLKRTVLGLLIGVQLLVLGATTAFVAVGVLSGALDRGHIFGFFVMIIGVVQLVAGCALAIRLFYLKKQQDIGSLRELKH